MVFVIQVIEYSKSPWVLGMPWIERQFGLNFLYDFGKKLEEKLLWAV